MTMYDWEDPVRFGRVSFEILKCDCEQMIVPRKATGERPRPRIGQVTRSGVALQRRRKVISVAKRL
jgi:hypothetical protein